MKELNEILDKSGLIKAAKYEIQIPSTCRATLFRCTVDKKRATEPKFVAQSKPALHFSQQLSSTRNKRFCCTAK